MYTAGKAEKIWEEPLSCVNSIFFFKAESDENWEVNETEAGHVDLTLKWQLATEQRKRGSVLKKKKAWQQQADWLTEVMAKSEWLRWKVKEDALSQLQVRKEKERGGFCFVFMMMSKVPSIYRTRKHVMEMLCKKEGHIWSKHAMILRGDLFSLSSIRTICQSIDFLDTVSDCTWTHGGKHNTGYCFIIPGSRGINWKQVSCSLGVYISNSSVCRRCRDHTATDTFCQYFTRIILDS